MFPAAGDGPRLEGALHLPEGSGPFPAAAVCHPHPQMGGTMASPVVVAVCQALAARDWIALRFNFRGAGRSEGTYDQGRGQMDDLAGALDFLVAWPEVDPDRLALAAYSFGAGVALHHAVRDPRPRRLVAIALVQRHYDDPFLDADPRPKLFLAGQHDPWAPPDALRAYVNRLRAPATLHVIPATDHFFSGHEPELAALVADFLAAP
jgi:alpha/beta superfamily hydrolase